MGIGWVREQKDVRSKSGWNQGRRTGVKKKECTDGCLKDRSMEGLVDGMMNIMKEDRRIEEHILEGKKGKRRKGHKEEQMERQKDGIRKG